jgi:hypothetical protein
MRQRMKNEASIEQFPFGFAGGEGDHGVTHERDADVVGEAAGDFFAV